MNRRSRKRYEVGQRAYAFSLEHPDPSPGYERAVATLGELLARFERLVDAQRNGIADSAMASRTREGLRRQMRRAHLAHLCRVAQRAEREEMGLAFRFARTLTDGSYREFRAAARGMYTEAVAREAVLVRYGLAATVLDGLAAALDAFDAATKLAADADIAHTGASGGLISVSLEIMEVVRTLDGLNRVRFEQNHELLPAWTSACRLGLPRHGRAAPEQEAGDEGTTTEAA